MWFKNIQIYRLTTPWELSAEQLNAALMRSVLRPCGKTELFSQGWISPFGLEHENYVHSANGYLLMALAREDKVLPQAVVRDFLAAKIAEIETLEGRKIFRKEKKLLHEDVLFELLPRAFVKRQITYAYIDPTLNLLVIDTPSSSRAEEFCKCLRDSLGSLKLANVEVKQTPALVMSEWLLKNNYPASLALDDECELIDVKSGEGLIRTYRQDLTSPEVLGHLKAGKQVRNLALTWQDRISFKLSHEMQIKRLRFLDIIQEQRGNLRSETPAEKLDADFTLMTMEFAQFISEIFAAFGGLKNHKANTHTQSETS